MKTKKRLTIITSAFIFSILVGFGSVNYINARAATCNSISDCQAQINSANNKVIDLRNTATSYQNAITILQAQVDQYQAQINASQAQQDQLNAQIIDAKNQIESNKQILAADIKAMYVNGQVSTLEQLASSQNLSNFVNAQTYRNAVNSKIQATLDRLNALKADLTQKQNQVTALLADEHSKQNAIVSARNQQQSMLSYNQSQISSFNAQTSQNQQKLNQLIAAQRAANNSSVSASGGGYYFIHFPGDIQRDPMNGTYAYANAGFGMSTAPGCVDNDGPDQWGYCTRQCVSYAAWAVAYSGRSAPIGWGDAKNWVYRARAAGIPFDATPEPGDVAISTRGAWGHAMYVEEVNGDQILVSQYNQQLTGQFSTQWRYWR